MMSRLPPLTALRAFEAAGRRLNFTRAAEELNVTQAAVSHQIRSLEQHLGVALFRRHGRGLALSEAGRALLPVLGEAFARIAAAIEGLGAASEGGVLSVTLRPYFGMKWLAPRLGLFWQACPQIALRLHHSIDPVDFVREEADLAVLWGRGDWPKVEAELLLGGELSPVCSPLLMAGPHPLRRPADLHHHNLLHEESHDLWTRWLTAADTRDIDSRAGTIIDDTNVRLEAAIDGQGVALGWIPLLAEDLAAGRLVRPFDLALEDYGYYVVYPSGGLVQAKVRAFRDWLLAEAARDLHTKGPCY
jgi:LysR family glycine cleavage system transcriptional activator